MSKHIGFGWRRRTRSSGSNEDSNNKAKVRFERDICCKSRDTRLPQEHWLRVGNNADAFRIHEKFCDVEITVDDEVFKAHKVILAAASSYFEGESHVPSGHFVTCVCPQPCSPAA